MDLLETNGLIESSGFSESEDSTQDDEKFYRVDYFDLSCPSQDNILSDIDLNESSLVDVNQVEELMAESKRSPFQKFKLIKQTALCLVNALLNKSSNSGSRKSETSSSQKIKHNIERLASNSASSKALHPFSTESLLLNNSNTSSSLSTISSSSSSSSASGKTKPQRSNNTSNTAMVSWWIKSDFFKLKSGVFDSVWKLDFKEIINS
jgi:hypothetical protein